jgi:hypothetical protein
MAEGSLHPWREEAGTTSLSEVPEILHFMLLMRAWGLCTHISIFLHCFKKFYPWKILCHLFLSPFFLYHEHTGSSMCMERHAPLLGCGGGTGFSGRTPLSLDNAAFFHESEKRHVNPGIWGLPGLTWYVSSLLLTGADICFQFGSEVRYEVCTDNLSVLRNGVLI